MEIPRSVVRYFLGMTRSDDAPNSTLRYKPMVTFVHCHAAKEAKACASASFQCVKKVRVIPSQCAHWRGNPPVLMLNLSISGLKSWEIATPGKRTGSQWPVFRQAHHSFPLRGNGWFRACWVAPNPGNTEIICGCAILRIAEWFFITHLWLMKWAMKMSRF